MRTDTGTARGSGTVWRALRAELDRARERGISEPAVVDVGGGSGVWAVPLATEGCRVTVVEPNPDALATLRRRAEEAGVGGSITVVADDTDALTARVPAGSADLVLAHGLLEVVDDPAAVVRDLAAIAAPGGVVSVLAANRHAAVLHRALGGRVRDAHELLTSPDGVLAEDGDTLLRRFDADGLGGLLTGAGLSVELLQGDGVVSDVLGECESEQYSADVLAEFEAEAGATPPLRDLASRLHLLARR